MGETDAPVSTDDGVAEPLNRSVAIIAVPAPPAEPACVGTDRLTKVKHHGRRCRRPHPPLQPRRRARDRRARCELPRPRPAARQRPGALRHRRGRPRLAALREELELDAGLLSRILAGLVREGLVALAPGPADRRRRRATWTKAGRAEAARYDALSDARAGRILAAQGRNGERLLAAMDLVAAALNRAHVEIAPADPDGARGPCLRRPLLRRARRPLRGRLRPGPRAAAGRRRPPPAARRPAARRRRRPGARLRRRPAGRARHRRDQAALGRPRAAAASASPAA